MKFLTFYFDPISPYAYLAFEQLPLALQGLSYSVVYKPVLFASFLKHHGQLGPAEIAPKRDWTYRQVQWLAHTAGIPLDMPAAHPFNPLALLRLALACAPEGRQPNRYVVETLLRHVWRGGADAADVGRLQALTAQLNPQRDPASDAVKLQLRTNTEEALARGLFGVPTCVVEDTEDGKDAVGGGASDGVFWGLDALPILRAYMLDDPWFSGPQWRDAGTVPVGVKR